MHGSRERSLTKAPNLLDFQPKVWFTQAEAQFNLHLKAADDMKYFYVLATLDQQTSTWLLDLIS